MSKIKYFGWYSLLKLRQWLGINERLEKDDLLVALRHERANIDALLDQVSSDDLELPGAEGHWSVKDVLAHFAAWDRRGLRWIETAGQGTMPQMPEPGLSWQAIDSLNEQTVVENRNRQFSDVRSDFERSYQALVDFVDGCPDEVVSNPIVAELISWRYKHYQRHVRSMRSRLQSRVVSD